MKVLLSWLKEFVDINFSEQELAHRLAMAGFEVEAVERFVPDFEKVVVGKVESIRPHPNADRLTLCQVNVGEAILSIVCGAKNVKEGDCVPVALDGARLRGNVVIKASKIRGEYSQGMMCSARELGFGEDREGIWLLPKDLPLGRDVVEVMGLRDTAFTLNVTPNRPDALSIRGIAREVAALTGGLVREPDRSIQEGQTPVEKMVQVSVQDFEACPRYMARLIRNVQVGPSPFWLRQRLERMGHRSINNVVDITNWVLLELGHPLHAFDFDRVEGAKVVVRPAQEGEEVVTIDGNKRTLQSSMLVIADASKPIALAGVMGGKDTEVSESTRTVLLECAYFSPLGIRRASKSLGLVSESSYRFERGVDPLGLPSALDRAAVLIQRVAGGEVLKGALDVYEKKAEERGIDFRSCRCQGLLGTVVRDDEIEAIFKRLQFKINKGKSDLWRVQVPTYRPDLLDEVDLIEEVARLWGYEKILQDSPEIRFELAAEPFSKEFLLRDKARMILRGLGLDEVITYGFLSLKVLEKARLAPKAVPLLNPVRQDYSHLRTSLIPNLLMVLSMNENRGSFDVRDFEIGQCFSPPCSEVEMLGLGLMGRADGRDWGKGRAELDFFYLKGLVEEFLSSLGAAQLEFSMAQHPSFHPGRCAQVFWKGEPLGVLGEAHPEVLRNFELRQRVLLAELDFEKLLSRVEFGKVFKELPRYPSVSRDIALVIGQEVSHQEVQKAIWNGAPAILEEVKLFDVYQGPQVPKGKKSLAYSLCFRSSEGTLKVEEVDVFERQIKEKLVKKFGCQFR